MINSTDTINSTDRLDSTDTTNPIDTTAFELMVTGGDSRITVQGENKLNGYGCSAYPSYSISYSSCTGSTISASAYAYAESYLHRMNKLAEAPEGRNAVFSAEFDRIRRKLTEFYEIPTDVDIVLGSSGTDLELIVLAIALTSNQPVHNIVLGANEVGSGINNAARGRYFSDLTPRGGSVESGSPIPGFDQRKISYHDIEIRLDDGSVRDEDEIMAEYVDQIEQAIAANRKVLLHMIHRTKTGLIIPSFNQLEKLVQRYGEAIDIVVDACQGRISIRLVNEYLKLGASVLLTGSKFYSGPPFSGALLIPARLAEKIKQKETVMTGLGDFFTRTEFPSDWTSFDDVASEEINMGLLLRWNVAIYEMNRVFLVPNHRIEFVVNSFNSAAKKMIHDSPFLQEAHLSTISREDLFPENTTSPFEINTIITFTIEESERFLSIDDAKLINRAMYSDLSGILNTDSKVAGISMQLGQPVKVSLDKKLEKWTASLRMALSSSHIGELGLLDDDIVRMRFESDFELIHEKLALVLENLDLLRVELSSQPLELSTQSLELSSQPLHPDHWAGEVWKRIRASGALEEEDTAILYYSTDRLRERL